MRQGERGHLGLVNRLFNAWVIVRPAEDLDDQWVAHCLDFDIASQGNSIHQAVQMAAEATVLRVSEDLMAGHDPLLRRAPEDHWEALWQTLRSGSPIDPIEVEEKQRAEVRAVAVSMVFGFGVAIPAATNLRSQPEKKGTWTTPVAFATKDGSGLRVLSRRARATG